MLRPRAPGALLSLLLMAAGGGSLPACGGDTDPPRQQGDVGSTDAGVDATTDAGQTPQHDATAADTSPPTDAEGEPDSGPADAGGEDEDGAVDSGVHGDSAVDGGLPELDPAIQEALRRVLQDYVAFSGEPGVALAVRSGHHRPWQSAAGLADVHQQLPVGDDPLFRVGSNTKPVIALLVLQLVDEGALALDDSVAAHLPEYPQWAQITVRQLLSMRSGIPEYLTRAEFMVDAVAHPNERIAPAHLLSFVADLPLLHEPDEGCTYTNSNYVLAGMLVERLTGLPIEQVIEQRVLAPLGLTRSFFDASGEPVPGLVRGYVDLEVMASEYGVPELVLDALPGELYIDDRLLDATYMLHPSVAWAAGGIVATPAEMATFVRALMRGELCSAAALEAMMEFSACALLGGEVDYGLGLMRHETLLGQSYGHGGLHFGYEAATNYVSGIDTAYSHMHNRLPEQSALLDYEVLAALSGDYDPATPCVPEEGFFADPAPPALRFSFKGRVSAADSPAPAPGVAFVEARWGERRIPLSGLYTSAKRTQAAFSTRLQVESYTLAAAGPVQVRQVTLSLDLGVLTRLDERGRFLLSAARPYELIAAPLDVEMVPGTQEPGRVCVTAVPDPARGGHGWICAPEQELLEGSLARVHGALALTTDPERIEAYLSPLGIARCLCLDEAGSWEACP